MLFILLLFLNLPTDTVQNDTLNRNKAYEQLRKYRSENTIHNKLDSIILILKQKQNDNKRIE
jgi:hypothetical protein